MIHIAYIFIIIFFSIIIQIIVGTYGIIFPITALSIIYLSVVYGWRKGIISAIISGIIIDILYGRTIFISPFTLIVISILAIVWLYKSNVQNMKLQTVPGGVAALIYTLPVLVLNYSLNEQGIYLLFINFLLLTASVLLGAFLMPIYISVLDSISKVLRINLYTEAQEKLNREL
ncbi:MAG TPA: hypothetical protein QF753_08700 [Victivallales bacterium]|nr:hypothetical protein [Victivallales bacterium]